MVVVVVVVWWWWSWCVGGGGGHGVVVVVMRISLQGLGGNPPMVWDAILPWLGMCKKANPKPWDDFIPIHGRISSQAMG